MWRMLHRSIDFFADSWNAGRQASRRSLRTAGRSKPLSHFRRPAPAGRMFELESDS
jgi:hypothetical protein